MYIHIHLRVYIHIHFHVYIHIHLCVYMYNVWLSHFSSWGCECYMKHKWWPGVFFFIRKNKTPSELTKIWITTTYVNISLLFFLMTMCCWNQGFYRVRTWSLPFLNVQPIEMGGFPVVWNNNTQHLYSTSCTLSLRCAAFCFIGILSYL